MILIEKAQQAGLSPKKKTANEYSSHCPSCGGEDRFVIQPYAKQKNCVGRYWCRQCDKKGDTIQFCIEFLGCSWKDALLNANATMTEPTRQLKKKSTSPLTSVKAPTEEWINKGTSFAEYANKQILTQLDVLRWLSERGLPIEAVMKYKIGWCPQMFNCLGSDWGFENEQSTDEPQQVWLPMGIVIPTFWRDKVIRLKIRQVDNKQPKYVAISGSMTGLNLIGDKSKKVMIVVESELDAYAIHYAVGDFALVVAVGSCLKNPDYETDYYAKQATQLLICHDNDEPGKGMYNRWKDRYLHAKAFPTSIGKDIGDAIKSGFDIRSWFLKKVDPDGISVMATFPELEPLVEPKVMDDISVSQGALFSEMKYRDPS